MRKSIATYRDLSKLLVLTKKIEHLLENQGGSGKGMWEKAKSIEENLFDGMLDEILIIADIRNKAMHHTPKIDGINEIIIKARKITQKLHLIDFKKRFEAKTRPERIIILTGFMIKISLFLKVLYEGFSFLYQHGQIGGLLLFVPFGYFSFKFFENIQDKSFFYLLLLIFIISYFYPIYVENTLVFIFHYISSSIEWIIAPGGSSDI